MKRRAFLLMTAALAGCTSIPVSTLWRLRNFGPEQLFALDPTELRAAARVESRARMKSATISIEVKPADGSALRAYVLPLERPVDDPRLERAPAARRWYAIGLSPQGLAEYQRIKRDFAAAPKGSHGTVKISADDDGTLSPELKKAFPLRLDVLLDPAEGYFTLISETKLDLSQRKK